MQGNEHETLTIEETAARLGIGVRATRDAAKRGELPTLKIGRRLLIPRKALDRVLAGEVLSASR